MESKYTRSQDKPLIGNLDIPCKLPSTVLPTNGDVIRAFYFIRKLSMREKDSNKVPSFNETKSVLIPDITSLWTHPNGCLPYVNNDRITHKIKSLIDEVIKMQAQPKNSLNSPAYIRKISAFNDNCGKLFDICTCDPDNYTLWQKKIVCPCEFDRRVPVKELSFLLDQRSTRKQHISASTDKKEERSNLRKLAAANRMNHPNQPSTSKTCMLDDAQIFSSEDDSIQSSEEIYSDENSSSTSDVSPKRRKLDLSVMSQEISVVAAKKLSSIRSTSELINVAADNLGVPMAKRSYITVYRQNLKTRQTLLDEGLIKLRNAVYHQICFDGKKLFDRERLAVLSNFLDGSFFIALKTFRKNEKTTGENCFNAIKSLIERDVYKNIVCLMSDTTSLNTGLRKGICSRFSRDINENFGHDITILECLFHCLEIYLSDIIKAFDGSTKSPDSLEEGTVLDVAVATSPRTIL